MGEKLGIAVFVVVAALVGGCLDDEPQDGASDGSFADGGLADESATDEVVSIECLETRGNARGALLEVRWMLNGEQRVDTSTIEGAETFMRRLAAQAGAPETVPPDLDRWDGALATWRDGLLRMEPQIVNGLFVEPDTTQIDQRLLAELAPLAERLGAWVETACTVR